MEVILKARLRFFLLTFKEVTKKCTHNGILINIWDHMLGISLGSHEFILFLSKQTTIKPHKNKKTKQLSNVALTCLF